MQSDQGLAKDLNIILKKEIWLLSLKEIVHNISIAYTVYHLAKIEGSENKKTASYMIYQYMKILVFIEDIVGSDIVKHYRQKKIIRYSARSNGKFDLASAMVEWRGALWNLLGNSDYEFIEALVERAAADREFAHALSVAFAKAKLLPILKIIDQRPDQSPSLPIAAPPPALVLPDKAPKLWADRDPGVKAAQFLRETYGPWIEAGVLTRSAIKERDKALYQAYHVWVHRHPEDEIGFMEEPSSKFISDPQEAIDRRRSSDRESKRRSRKKVNLSHPKP